MNEQFINIKELSHHIEHLVLYSFVIWQTAIASWLVIRWTVRNIKFYRSPIVNVEESLKHNDYSSEKTKIKKNIGPVEVDFKRNILIGKAEKTKIDLDEVTKGKVKTQSDKLKKFRNKIK